MRLTRRFLLGSVATVCTAPAALAADLPARTMAPVEYVQSCYSAERKSNRTLEGFFALPGTDTCLRISGRARFSYQYMSSRAETNIYGANRGQVGGDNSGFQTLAFLNFDARTATDLGVLRTFVRVIAAYSSGGHLTSGTSQRFAQSYPSLGLDTYGRANTTMYLDKAFVQYLGFTAGRAASFFDFYAQDVEHFAATSGSNVGSTNLLAYTATFGGGWSATLSMEDPIARRQPRFGDTAGGTPVSGGASFSQLGGAFTQGVPYAFVGGVPTRAANYDVTQRESMPDFVGVIRYDAPWGSAQVSGAMHQLTGGRLLSTSALASGTSGLPTIGASTTDLALASGLPGKVKDEIGWAVQGGLKINLPQLAAGDVLWLQAAYADGALSYTGHPARLVGSELLAVQYSGRMPVSTVDSFIGADGKQKLTESWSVTAAFLHYWTPQWRSAVFGSYGEVSFGKGARTGAGPAVLVPDGTISGANSLAYDARLRDYSVATIGANLVWSPVKDLDIGVEGIYSRVGLKSGRTADQTVGTVALTGLPDVAGNRTIPLRTVKSDDLWAMRMRVQRDF